MRATGANWKHGPTQLEEGVWCFRVWAPHPKCVNLHLLEFPGRSAHLEAKDNGYFEAIVDGIQPGIRYCFQVDGRDLPDPASRFQPEGVHGPSQLVDPNFEWQDSTWPGLPLDRFVLYELHVGTFSLDGTFDAIIPHLEYLRDLGTTAIELMPVAQFPGGRNWGYDGVSPFAAQDTYGGPLGLKRLVNACHQRGMAVVLDVVYNHLGPEGNYLSTFGPYFTTKYKTPWGSTMNFDGEDSDEVRRFFVENALYWICECHIDALRLDAVHAIHDESAFPFLAETTEAVHRAGADRGRLVYVIAESDLNDTRVIRASEAGGLGFDSQWSDDFHHSLCAVLTGERAGYYQDFGDLAQLAKAYRDGFVYSGQYSRYRRRRHGNSSAAIAPRQLVVFVQNHDQVGNRMLGERLSALVSFEQLKLAAGALFLSPFIPLMFMGEEYGETAPFLYFVSHSDPGLIEAVRSGREKEFAAFSWQQRPPDPQDEATFARSRLDHHLRNKTKNGTLLSFYRELIRLRTTLPALASLSKETMDVTLFSDQRALCLRRWKGKEDTMVLFSFASTVETVRSATAGGRWRKVLDSSDQRWLGAGGSLPEIIEGSELPLSMNSNSVVVYRRETEA
jgi:maltooligosyltrehalose trehalohydrolase